MSARALLWMGGLMVGLIAVLFARYDTCVALWPALEIYLGPFRAYFDAASPGDDVSVDTGPTPPRQQNAEPLFTAAELSTYDGSAPKRGLRLALLGQVFDVSRGEKHYGPGGAYHHFAGRDATKSFVTGEFAPEELSDDVTGLTPDEMLELENWMKFYKKDYDYKGKLIGRYYDSSGRPTEALRQAEEIIAEGHRNKRLQEDDRQRFPGCNSEWAKGKGGKVWCSTRSGGVDRDWTGVPRQMLNPTSGETRCVCVHPVELKNPNLKEFPGCSSINEPSCQLQEEG